MPTTLSTAASIPYSSRAKADRIGVFASILCAIHCVITPPMLLLLPAFGRAWSHPASHWGMAVLVVPLAAFSVWRGFRSHRRKWVVVSGTIGIALVLTGAALPYLPADFSPAASETCNSCDTCCPSLQTDGNEETRLVIPPASAVTTLGGLALVLAHLGNLCRCCPSCRRVTAPA